MHTSNARYNVNFQHDSDETADRCGAVQQRVDTIACTALFKRYERELFRRCKYRLGNSEDAEDAVQETLYRAFRAIEQFEGKSSLRTWLYAIADNQCGTIAGRRMRYQLSEHMSALIEIHELNHRYREEFEDCAQVSKVLNELPTTAKKVLEMRFYTELSLEEIAHNLGIGLSAAKMRLYRAQDAFKRLYNESSLTT
ncbi:MAG: RNA polymerase sigma factor [Gammaproteobacteria bacterium]|nr:RNA polymerase sigma factor [Gammaproteobacteria bacterium]NNJ98100.1 RNA polymerase sigma factor [Gammaproteobacteria bacterium]